MTPSHDGKDFIPVEEKQEVKKEGCSCEEDPSCCDEKKVEDTTDLHTKIVEIDPSKKGIQGGML